MDERKAIDLCLKHHDPVGFERLVQLFRREAYMHAYAMLGNEQDAAARSSMLSKTVRSGTSDRSCDGAKGSRPASVAVGPTRVSTSLDERPRASTARTQNDVLPATTGVPVEYLVFEDEGHGFQKKKNMIAACMMKTMPIVTTRPM